MGMLETSDLQYNYVDAIDEIQTNDSSSENEINVYFDIIA
jgi:hypothetical protein